MTKEQYFRIRSELRFDRWTGATLAILGVDVLLLLGVSYALAQPHSALAYWTAQFVLALVYFHHFAVLHEAGHGSAATRPWINTLIGHYASLFCFLPYYPWKYIHYEHHTWTGNLDHDPTLHELRKMKAAHHVPLGVRFAWRSWIPLGGLLQHTVFWLYPCRAWSRLPNGPRWRSAASVAFLLTAYTTLAWQGPAWLTWANLWPSLVIYLVGVELVNFPHHIDMPVLEEPDAKLAPWEQAATTRSCDYGIWSAVLVLNFNLHTEHHLYPTLPWFRLKAVRDRIRSSSHEYHEEKGIAWNLRNRARDARDIILRRRVIRPHSQEPRKAA